MVSSRSPVLFEPRVYQNLHFRAIIIEKRIIWAGNYFWKYIFLLSNLNFWQMKEKMSVKAELISPIKMFETPEKIRKPKKKKSKRIFGKYPIFYPGLVFEIGLMTHKWWVTNYDSLAQTWALHGRIRTEIISCSERPNRGTRSVRGYLQLLKKSDFYNSGPNQGSTDRPVRLGPRFSKFSWL